MRESIRWLLAACLALAAPGAAGGASVCGPAGCPADRGAAPYAQAPPLTGPVADGARAVVRVTHRTAGGASLGSGTIVAAGGPDRSMDHVVTCAHLFNDGPGSTSVSSRAVGQTPAEVVAIDRANDLALLRTPRLDAPRAGVGLGTPSGELTSCGFGPAGVFLAVRGRLLGYSTAAGATSPSLRVAGAVRPGDSGGAVLDQTGLLVGVVWGAREGETYAMFGAPLRRLLERIPGLESPGSAPAAGRAGDSAPAAPPRSPAAAPPAPPAVPAPDRALGAAIAGLERRMGERLEGALARVAAGAKAAAAPAEETSGAWLGALAAALGVGGPVGVALVAAAALVRSRSAGPSRRAIAIDTPPPPQQVVPETHYVPYERDEFARAHQWASEQLARKFPGSVEWLAGLESLIRQKLNSG